MNDQLKRNCLWCKWRSIKDEEKERWLDETDNDYVILAKYQKITGQILVVSKQPCDDITDLTPGGRTAGSIMSSVVRWSKRLKKKLPNMEKVYVMTMCEHWEAKDIDSDWTPGNPHPKTTEHMHFHLLPRHRGMRTKEAAMENLFTRHEDYEWDSQMFERLESLLIDDES